MLGARFINFKISSMVDKWYGESQKRAEAVFTLVSLRKLMIIGSHQNFRFIMIVWGM